jgi:hypothetical protein
LSFDYAAYKRGKGFVIFAESEFDNSTDENLQGDFEKLLYVRSMCKVMMCWVSNAGEAIHIAEMLSDYANRVCDEFAPDEVYVLYFANWISDQEEAAFVWQTPSVLSKEGEKFTFRALPT